MASCKGEYCKPQNRYLECGEDHCSTDCVDNPENQIPPGCNKNDYQGDDE